MGLAFDPECTQEPDSQDPADSMNEVRGRNSSIRPEEVSSHPVEEKY